jgi:glycine dehydrogenase subunit 2
MHNHEPPIFELSGPGKIGVNLPQIDVPQSELPADLLRADDLAGLPELTEPEVIRHYTRISQRNFAIDTTMVSPGGRVR